MERYTDEFISGPSRKGKIGRMPLTLKSGLLIPTFATLLGLVGCTADKPSPSPQKVERTPEPSDASQGHRFAPTGANPEIALDTLSGTLCRTIEPTTGATDKYAKLPMCGAEPASSPATPVKFAWSEALKGAPLTASCYRAKSLVAGIFDDYPGHDGGNVRLYHHQQHGEG